MSNLISDLTDSEQRAFMEKLGTGGVTAEDVRRFLSRPALLKMAAADIHTLMATLGDARWYPKDARGLCLECGCDHFSVGIGYCRPNISPSVAPLRPW